MDDLMDPYVDVRAPGLDVRLDRRMRVASLRHLSRDGGFARQCQATFGVGLPEALRAVCIPGATLGQESILAWRNSTTTLMIATDEATFDTMLSDLSPRDDGCCVDQSGGVWVLRASGVRVTDLLLRIGNVASIPSVGEAHVSRVAELPVMTLSVMAGETLMLIDRAYAEHLLNWIRATARDLDTRTVSPL